MYTVCMRYNISIPQSIMTELDNYAQTKKYNRSEAIREAIRRMTQSKDIVDSNRMVVDDIILPNFSKSKQAKGLSTSE